MEEVNIERYNGEKRYRISNSIEEYNMRNINEFVGIIKWINKKKYVHRTPLDKEKLSNGVFMW